ncbi:MAG: hypothetical protein K2K93_02970 [Muribaculaceae bacterium]|nr:hypothetical protein [Muribaculaceae bacterium]
MNIHKASFMLSALLMFQSVAADVPQYEVIQSPAPISAYGNIMRMTVDSENLDGKVTVDVWTPTGYDAADGKRYPVIYAHDGQNLFDASFSFAGVAWAIDKACAGLAGDPDFLMPIIVGINNRGAEGLRANDYFPEKAIDYIAPERMADTFIFDTCGGTFFGDEEAAFVATELKPLIDNLFNTSPEVSATFAMGSSMGALASIYLLCEYPDIFGGAACISTHWIGSLHLNADYTLNDDEVCADAILRYLDEHLPSAGAHRLYLDQGTTGWDAQYLKYEAAARTITRSKGYSEGDCSLCVYDAVGAGHNEWYWQQRADVPLRFLLSKKAIGSTGFEDIAAGMENAETPNYIYDLSGRRYPASDSGSLQPGIYIQDRRASIKR